LPGGWTWASLAQIAEIQGGIQKQPSRQPKKNVFSFLRVANVYRSRLDLGEMHMIEPFQGELNKLRLEPGNLLIVEGNGSPSEIGRMAIWNGEIENCVHQNHIIRARILGGVVAEFCAAFWNSREGAAQVLAVSRV
jgi:type I restriction enzyme S subunit